jgi:hypothetical protein
LFGVGKPLPTSLALMVGEAAVIADDAQEHRLRRAMKAASAAEQALPEPEPLQVETVSEAPVVPDVFEPDEAFEELELSEAPPAEPEAPPMVLGLEVAVAAVLVEEVEIEATLVDVVEFVVEEVPEVSLSEPEVLDVAAAVAEVSGVVTDIPAAEPEELVVVPEAVAPVLYELSEAQADPSEAQIAADVEAEEESVAVAKKAPKKKAAAKKAPKKKAAPRKRKEAAPAEDTDDDAAPVEGPASFEGTVEASAP